MQVLTQVVVVQHLDRRGKQLSYLLPDPFSSIAHHAQAHLPFGDQPRFLHLPQGLSHLGLGLYLMPAQHLDHSSLIYQIEPETFGFPPLPFPPGPSGTLALLTLAWPSRYFRTGGHMGSIQTQNQNGRLLFTLGHLGHTLDDFLSRGLTSGTPPAPQGPGPPLLPPHGWCGRSRRAR